MAHLDACAYGMQQSVSLAAPCHSRCAKAPFRPFWAAQTPTGGCCHSHSKPRPLHSGRCHHDAVPARKHRTSPTQHNSMTHTAQPAEQTAPGCQQSDLSDRRMLRRHALLAAAAAVSAATGPYAVQPAAAKSSSGDWTSPGLATAEDDAAPK